MHFKRQYCLLFFNIFYIFQNSQENNCASLFLIKLQAEAYLVQVFSCEFWEIFSNTCFPEHLRTTVSAEDH